MNSKVEWLETNGTGAFAMGTAEGLNTRRYHALLVATLKPPVERYVLLSRVEEAVLIDGRSFAIACCQYPGVAPSNEYLAEFRAAPCATWVFNLDGARLEKQVYLIEGRQAVVVRYRADRAVTLRVRPFTAYRDYHSLRKAGPDPYGSLPLLTFQHSGRFEADAKWYYNIEYLLELERGLDFREDLYTPGVIVLDLQADQWRPILAGIESAELAEPVERAEPFTVRRADGKPTIIAGYPWFTDWGRDTMISLPGLLITPGRLEEAREILKGFLAHLNQGLIPNRFPDSGESPEYNTADATLWMFQAMRHWLAASGSETFLRDTFYPAAKEIIAWHRRGTHHDIGVDPEDHLLSAGKPGSQLTWMDAKVGARVVTPRHGKPVEINALWHGALTLAAEWSELLGDQTDFRDEAERVKNSFRAKFWNARRICLFDTLAPEGPIDKIRPNQIFAVSLGHGLVQSLQRQTIVRVVERELLTGFGLRTLARSDPDYRPRYQGSPAERDAAYHQGTVWPWLLGPYLDAYFQAFGHVDAAMAPPDLIAEIYDGDEPREARGCPFQAWTVAELARVRGTYFRDSK
ncbi:MAG TPA: amylo-alpha-1,6-glucosidase [Bryobacteraceae bacterium]|nr:amylo-alpha-1,6-glucosidase [Bryobacteraceae bacterium]